MTYVDLDAVVKSQIVTLCHGKLSKYFNANGHPIKE